MTAAVDLPPPREVPMPDRVAALPRNRAGYPVPFFVATVDGEPDFRVTKTFAHVACLADRRCWICGQRGGADLAAFTIGPMCAVNRITSEPPSHVECAEYAAKACPFLSRPGMVRRERGLPAARTAAGTMIKRNPGVALVWVTHQWTTFPQGNGLLFELGEPSAVSWWAHGRPATRSEVVASITSGMPLLEECCVGPHYLEDVAELTEQYERALRYLPAEEAPCPTY